MDSKALQLLILSLVSIVHFPNCGTSQCDRAHLLKECVPCVASGTVLEHPDVNCCKAVNALGHNCLCSLIVSSTGVLAKETMKRYVESCQVVLPEDYQCEGIM
ncbi:tapetum-specific protein A9-like [Selaginella moellendorffii]|uniref:tapetum-specific protein A9-like n=1 Tax=Selaginella moellendorffii TaxID=88036 RepID=UPI000D1C61D3|nr:tapetum-specific protein A9-like [Selaginella moellendorffii]|eukprot:XP_024537359.1 tapetum-specific protein A9-like [Selaginella moellendorffii]